MKAKIWPVLICSLLSLLCIRAYAGIECFNALESDTELQPIKDKVALVKSNEQSFRMLANEEYPTSEESQVIYKWAIKREHCLKSYPPPDDPITKINFDGFYSIQYAILDLYKGRITYGQLARKTQEIVKDIETKSQQISYQYQQQQIQRRQSDNDEYQSCLNRASNQLDVSRCNMQQGGRGLGRAIGDAIWGQQ